MDFDSGIPMSRPPVTAQVSSSLSPPLDEADISDALWQLNLRSSMESGPYPVREGEPDCSYYIRTGLCRFGATCRFNHPANRKLAIATAKMMGEYPERAGQPECQYYLKTGTCKFGATCKFDHPRDKAGIAGRVSLNVLGYPLRPNEAECGYYLRTGQCKFGNTCKFHHPQPSNMMVTYSGSPVYPTLQPPTSPGQQGEITNWSLPQASFVPSPRWQAPSSYTQMILPQGVVSLPAYRGSSESQHQASGSNQIYGLARENVFPERPGQPDCQFYIKTGDCKFGAVCRFHHPRERVIPAPDCVLSPIGLPIRPGEPLCIFYSRYGICKFGPSCKFDHPMGVFSYNFSSNTGDDGRLLPSSSSGNMTSQGPIEGGSITQMPSTDNNTIDQQE